MDQFMVGTKQSCCPGQYFYFSRLCVKHFQLQLFGTFIKLEGWGSRKAADCTVQPATNQSHWPKTTKMLSHRKIKHFYDDSEKQQPFCYVMIFLLLQHVCTLGFFFNTGTMNIKNTGFLVVIAAPPPGPSFVFRPECGSGVFGDRAASLSDVGFAEIRSALFLWAIGYSYRQKSAERNKSAGNKELLSGAQLHANTFH